MLVSEMVSFRRAVAAVLVPLDEDEQATHCTDFGPRWSPEIHLRPVFLFVWPRMLMVRDKRHLEDGTDPRHEHRDQLVAV